MELMQSQKVLNQMAHYWGDRAMVKSEEYDIDLVYDVSKDDFLDELIPLHGHHDFDRHYEEFRTLLLSSGWIAYNEKTIDIESQIITPACIDLIYKRIPGSEDEAVRWAASETLVDEGYHVLMVVNAMRACKKNRGLNDLMLSGFALTENMNKAIAQAQYEWQKRLIRLGTSIVSEVFISDYLGLLSESKGIQPINRITTEAHRHDELAHSGIFKTFTSQIFNALNSEQKRYFIEFLPKPISWFASRELGVWEKILQFIGFPNAQTIIQENRSQGEIDLSRIDYSELIQLVKEVGILDNPIGRDAFIKEGVIKG